MSSPNSESSGPPLRALAMVLISLAILFAAIGALSLTGSGDTEAASGGTSEAEQAPSSSAAPATSAAPTTTVSPADVDLRVLNNSDIAGLAAETATTLTSNGWIVAETGNYSETQVPSTTVYYGSESGAEAAATDIAQQLGATAEAKPVALTSFGDGVIVMVTQ